MADVWVLSEWVQDEGGAKVWGVARDYPAEWSDATSQPDADILAGLDRCVVRGRVSEAQRAALEADSRYPLLPADATELEPEQVAALKAEIAASMSSDVAALVTDAATPAEMVARMVEAAQYPPWKPDMDVQAGEVYTFERNLYQVREEKAHRTQADWTPDIAVSLFRRYYEPSDDPWPWVQPQGSHDAWAIEARVTHNGHIWHSLIDNNVWEPGSDPRWWECVDCDEPEPGDVPEWAVGVAYKGDNTEGEGKGDVVTYQGAEYRCLQSHTSIATWAPGAAGMGAIWLKL